MISRRLQLAMEMLNTRSLLDAKKAGLPLESVHLLTDADIIKHLKLMPKGAKEHLRGLIDWVEEYELHEVEP